MGYAARLSPASKHAEKKAKWRRLARNIKSPAQFERVIINARPEVRKALRELLTPMLPFVSVPVRPMEGARD